MVREGWSERATGRERNGGRKEDGERRRRDAMTRGEQETEWEAGVVGVVVARVARPCCLCG